MIGELGMIRRYGLRRVWHLLAPGRKEREREAQRVVSAAAGRLLDAPIASSSGLNLRQLARLGELGLKWEVCEKIMFGPPLLPGDLDRLLNNPESVRAEFPEMFDAAKNADPAPLR